jgi:hypothetical protein
MVFPHQGQNHANGIKNEKDVVKYQNLHPTSNFNNCLLDKYQVPSLNWTHEGGTQTKADAIVHLSNKHQIPISIKNHNEGSLDWLNTTKDVPESLKLITKEFKEKYISKENIDEAMREELENIFHEELNKFSSQTLSIMLNNLFDKYPEWILVNDQKNKRFITFNKINLKRIFDKDNDFILKSTRAKSSRQIWLKNEQGLEVNTNLRIRIHLNNGISALFSKKGSSPCIKIQQDKVDEFIASCSDKIIDQY